MRISVVIGTRNRARLLAITLDHLRDQAYTRGDEVIVVDNGGTDATAEVVRRAAADFPVPLIYLVEHELGKSAAVNCGVRRARGAILALTDDDVQVAPDWIASIRRVFSDGTVDLAGGRVDPWWEAAPPWWLRWHRPDSSAMLSPLALLHYGEPQDLGERTAVGANLIVRREVYDALGGFNPDLGRQQGTLLCGEDHDFCMRAAARYRCQYRPEIRVRHWVPKDRLRIRYFTRWFYWSGITNARLDSLSAAVPAGGCTDLIAHMGKRVLVVGAKAVLYAATFRPAAAVEHLMEAAFAVGYLAECLRPAAVSRQTSRDVTAAAPGARVA